MKGASRDLVTLFYAPRRFFQARADDSGGNLAATGFALGMFVCGTTLDWAWARFGWNLQTTAAALRDSWPKYIVVQVVFFAVMLPLEALAVHFILYGMSFARASFGATYRVCAYSLATAALSVIPFVGEILGSVVGIALLVIGIRETHRTSTRAAILVTALGWVRLLAILSLAGLGFITLVYR